MPKKKYRLHATRVDRIAVVDRPAVPDAQIVVYKRHGGEETLDKGALAYQDLPIGEMDMAWDSNAALERVKAKQAARSEKSPDKDTTGDA